ncbi:MAG: hypothetical protein LBG66_06025, partial [Gallionellaceae bacterium]|nr:hypothetical protein [Gallionellaceae bacterium]
QSKFQCGEGNDDGNAGVVIYRAESVEAFVNTAFTFRQSRGERICSEVAEVHRAHPRRQV